MIVEWLRHLCTPCPQSLKRLGVLHDLIALDHRAKRQRQAWKAHQLACQRALCAFADLALQAPSVNRPTRAVILGSGLLLEIPLATLAERFDQVILVDLYHMPQVRRRARPWPHVSLVCHDVSGLLDRRFDLQSLPMPVVDFPHADGATLVVSCNLLSQISGIPLAIADTLGGYRPDHLVAWERRIISSHLDALANLAQHGVTVGLICDTTRTYVAEDAARKPPEAADLLAGVPLPPLQDRQSWSWNLAPAPEESRHWSVHHQVTAGVVSPMEGSANPGQVYAPATTYLRD